MPELDIKFGIVKRLWVIDGRWFIQSATGLICQDVAVLMMVHGFKPYEGEPLGEKVSVRRRGHTPV